MPGRKIEVQLVGDASDLQRSLTGALAALKAFGAASDSNGNKITKLGADGERAGKKLDYAFQGAVRSVEKFGAGLSGPYGILKPVGLLVQGWAKLTDILGQGGKRLEQVAQPLEQIGTEGEQAVGMFASMGTTLAPLLGLVGPLALGLSAVGGALLILPAIAAAATFALVALLDAVTSLAAIIAALAGPVLVLTGLLGGLGAAFAYVATQSFKNKATQQQVHDNLLKLHVAQQTYNQDLAKYGKNATQTENALLALHKAQDAYEQSLFGVQLHIGELQDKLSSLVKTLGKDFRPELVQLADAANVALTYLNRIAKLPLKQAFQSLATQGVALLSKFVYGIANVLKKPFRLAVQIAFGTGGQNAQAAVTAWWTSLTKYLFGYTKTKTIHIGSRLVMDQKSVKGALEPIVKWFERQHFTKTGLRWANEIIHGVTHSAFGKAIEAWAVTVAKHAGHMAGAAFTAALGAEIKSWGPSLFKWLWQYTLLAAVLKGATDSAHTIESVIGAAFDSLKSKAEGIWNSIVSWIEGHIPTISLHVNMPSIPSVHIPGTSWSLPHTGGVIGAFGTRGYAGGGLVMGGVPGRDSVPAMLTPGEMVLTRGQQMALLHGGAGATTVQVFIGEEQLEQRMYKVVRADNRKTARALQAQRAWGG